MVFLFYFSNSLTSKEEIVYSIEYLIEKKIKFESNNIYSLVMTLQNNYELENLFIKVIFNKTKNVPLILSGMICYDDNYTLSDCNFFNISDSDKMHSITEEGDELFQYPINNFASIRKYYYCYFVFRMEFDTKQSLLYLANVLVYPLKIFDLDYSTELNIINSYKNKTILGNSFFYLRIKEENFMNATLKLTTKIETFLNVVGKEYPIYPNNKSIQNTTLFDKFFCDNILEENPYYINNYELSYNNKYLVLIVYLNNSLDYLTVSLTGNYHKDSDKESEDSEAPEDPEDSEDLEDPEDPDDSSTSPALIAFIVIICILFMAFIVYFILRKLGYFRKKLLNSDEIEFNKKPSINQNITTQGDENNNFAPPTPILERSYIKEKD